MDTSLRRLYRDHFTDPSDPERRARLERALARLGVHRVRFPDLDPPEAPDPWGEVEEDLRLHERARPEEWWRCGCAHCLGKNAKKKTLRTHRDPRSKRGRIGRKKG